MRGIHGFNKKGLLPQCVNKHGISVRIFQRPVHISQGMWPPRSSHFSPPDLFLWGHLKGHVNNNNPHRIEEMKKKKTM